MIDAAGTQCVILAGGLGTRMRPLTEAVPKALLPVAGEPFAHHQLRRLAAEGVARAVYCIGYRGEAVREAIGDGSRFGIAVTYVDEGNELRGTAGALRLALNEGVLDDAFAVMYGDSYLPAALDPIWRAFRASTLPALMTVYRNEDRWDRSNALVDAGRVVVYNKTGSHPQARDFHWIDYGLAILSREIIAGRVAPGTVADLAELYRDLSADGLLEAHEVRERFYEVGSPEGLAELERYLAP